MGIYWPSQADRNNIKDKKERGGICIIIPERSMYGDFCGIYKIMFNDHFYIGKSTDIIRRMTFHAVSFYRLIDPTCSDYGKRGKIFRYLINNPTLCVLYLEIIELCDAKILVEREQFYLNKHISDNKCLNIKTKSTPSREVNKMT